VVLAKRKRKEKCLKKNTDIQNAATAVAVKVKVEVEVEVGSRRGSRIQQRPFGQLVGLLFFAPITIIMTVTMMMM